MSDPVSDDDFVKMWRETPNVRDMADRLGMLYGRVVARARKLRAAGLDLPLKRRSPKDNESFDEGFRAIWVTSGSRAEVARRSGLALSGVAVKASKMRKAGYDLPLLAAGRPRTRPPRAHHRRPEISRSKQAAALAKKEQITLSEAARLFGISAPAVWYAWKALYPGTRPRRGRPPGPAKLKGEQAAAHDTARRMARNGSTAGEIAVAIGYSRQGVYNILRRAP